MVEEKKTKAKKVGEKIETPKEKPKVETEEKKEAQRVEVKKEKISKDKAVVNGYSLHISTKYTGAIGKMIRLKTIDRAIEMLDLVLKKKMAVPMTALEIPHRKRSLMPGPVGGAGRFPANASREVVHLLKQLKANCEVNGIENPVITLFVANIGSRPFRKDRTRGKRTHVYIEAKDKTKLVKKKK